MSAKRFRLVECDWKMNMEFQPVLFKGRRGHLSTMLHRKIYSYARQRLEEQLFWGLQTALVQDLFAGIAEHFRERRDDD